MPPDAIKALRTRLSLSQQGFADRINALNPHLRADRNIVSRWERGAHTPDAHYQAALRRLDGGDMHYILYALEDGTGVVVHRDAEYQVVGGHAGFSAEDVAEARADFDAGGDANLADWTHLEITPDAASYVAATYRTVGNA